MLLEYYAEIYIASFCSFKKNHTPGYQQFYTQANVYSKEWHAGTQIWAISVGSQPKIYLATIPNIGNYEWNAWRKSLMQPNSQNSMQQGYMFCLLLQVHAKINISV